MQTVKEYLLGTLSDTEASAIEEHYVTNPLFFNQVRAAEIDLIIAYLDGKLSPEEHEQFENRYLTLPALREMVERIRMQRAETVPAAVQRRRLILASSTAVILIFAFFLRMGHRPQQQAGLHPPPAAVRLVLEPGVTMGPSSQSKLLKLPSPAAPIAMVAELPGQTSSADYIATLRNVDAERTQPALWTSNLTRSMPGQGGQEVTVTLDSSIFTPGDYILELKTQTGKTRETYLFRATASQ
jgi:anti-sigma factor RsiW